MSRYELFLDESGDFFETSTDRREQAKAATGSRAFPSQIAGVLAPAGRFSEQWAATRLAGLKASIGLSPDVELHAKDHAGEVVSQLVRDIVTLFDDDGLQPVRIVNEEGVSYGNKQLIYVSMLAELALRVCATLARTGERQIELAIVTANVFLDPASPGERPWPIPAEEYDKAIQQILGFHEVQRGNAGAARGWRIGEVQLRHAADDARLQFCDVISNASKASFAKITPAGAERLRGAFGEYDFTMRLPPLLQSIDALLQDGYLGMALCAIAQRLVGPDTGAKDVFNADPGTRRVLRVRLDEVVDRLAKMDAGARNAHLQVVTAWLEQLIDARLALSAGARLAQWMRERVSEELSQRIPASAEVEWFGFACARWKLTAANHLGDLEAARAASLELDTHMQRLAGRWEHVTLLLDALVARAVHLTDAWESKEAARQMRLVDGYYADLGALFSVAMPSLFPDEIRSDVRARALGTWVQAELAACAQDAERIGEARRLSELALREFDTQADILRQCQYRSHLEALAGAWLEAEQYLARGVGLDAATPLAQVTLHIQQAEPMAQGFPLLHLLRLLARLALEGSSDDRCLVARLLRETRILTATRWTAPEETELADYPRHGVLRYAAVVAAASGDLARGVQLVGALRGMVDVRSGPLALVATVLAALTEVGLAGLQMGDQFASRLLGVERHDRPGAGWIASVLAQRAARSSFDRMSAQARTWEAALAGIVREPTSQTHRGTLIQLARSIS
jgi:hypothetical protein